MFPSCYTPLIPLSYRLSSILEFPAVFLIYDKARTRPHPRPRHRRRPYRVGGERRRFERASITCDTKFTERQMIFLSNFTKKKKIKKYFRF